MGLKWFNDGVFDRNTGVQWCEPKYVVNDKIAEFFNTVSNIPLIILPLVSIYLQPGYMQLNPPAKYLLVSLSFVGVMSGYYHATLSLSGQFFDEISIFWTFWVYVVAFFPTFPGISGFLKANLFAFRACCLALVTICTGLCFIKSELNYITMMSVIGPSVMYTVWVQGHRNKDGPAGELYGEMMSVMYVGLTFWFIDFLACPLWRQLGIPYFHGLWHIFAGALLTQAIALNAYFDMKDNYSEEMRVTLKHIPQCIHGVPVLQYFEIYYIAVQKIDD